MKKGLKARGERVRPERMVGFNVKADQRDSFSFRTFFTQYRASRSSNTPLG